MKRKAVAIVRLFFGLLTFVAIGVQFSIHLKHGFNVVNFFSYFTNLSNILVAIVFVVSGFNLWRGKQPDLSDDLIRGASTLYIVIVGLVYSTLLIGEDLGTLLPWVNAQLHIVMPIVVLLDWLYQPAKHQIEFKQVMVWLIYPLVFLIYSLVRGALVGWYPYPFLNPDLLGGYGAVAVYCSIILFAFIGVAWVLIALGNRFKRNVDY